MRKDLKMKPLPTTQLMLTWFLFLENKDNSLNWWKKISRIGFTAITLVLTVCQVFATGAFALKYLSIDFQNSLYALYAFFGWTMLSYLFIVALFSRRKITLFIDKFSKVHHECKYILSTIL